MVINPVYLDNHATTRCDPRVVEAMLPYFTEFFGNAASVSHRFGWDAEKAVEKARDQVATLIGATPKELVFTSGATEANNLSLKGSLPHLRRRGNHIISAASEHRAVLDPLKHMAREGWEVTFLLPDSFGMITPDAVCGAMRPETVLVSIMAANNEVGTINPISEIGKTCRERGILFHTDATQAIGKIPLDVNGHHIDLLSLSAHKFYGPKGIGALYIRRSEPRIRIVPQIEGGGHEGGFRSGTLAVPLIVGLGHAAALAGPEREDEADRIGRLRDKLEQQLRLRLDHTTINGHPTARLPGNLNMSFGNVEGEALMMTMREVAVSSGSACSAADPEPSHVLRAMGLDEDLARSSLRFGLGRFTTEEEIDFAIERTVWAVERLRTLHRG